MIFSVSASQFGRESNFATQSGKTGYGLSDNVKSAYDPRKRVRLKRV